MKTGKFLEMQEEEPIEFCHFDVIDDEVDSLDLDEDSNEHSEAFRVRYDKAYLTHIFSCRKITDNPKVLPLMACLDISITNDEDVAFKALENLKKPSGVGMSPAHWISLAKFYTDAGFNVYLSENMLEVYPGAN